MKIIKFFTIVLSVTMLFTSCYMNGATRGSLIGGTGRAVVGAMAGKALGNSALGASIGSAVGSAVGSSVGAANDAKKVEQQPEYSY